MEAYRIQNSEHLYEEKYNNHGCLMKIVEYNNAKNIVVEFQDEYKTRVHTGYNNFQKGLVRNPYYPSVYGIGIVGVKYPVSIKSIVTKEYDTWKHILQRCYDSKLKAKQPAYQDASCCKEWLNYENFYEWLHNQPNFEKWLNGDRWAIDKDILNKKNKIYSPENCCLVPQNVNCLFLKREAERGKYPIGVKKSGNKFEVNCMNPLSNKHEHLGKYNSIENAFYLGYKPYKENIIKQVAQIEFDASNITEQCYLAMMNYEVEITD